MKNLVVQNVSPNDIQYIRNLNDKKKKILPRCVACAVVKVALLIVVPINAVTLSISGDTNR